MRGVLEQPMKPQSQMRLSLVQATFPPRTTLPGQTATLEPLNRAAHGDALYEAMHGPAKEQLWRYLWWGPFEDRAAFDSHLNWAEKSTDIVFYAIVDNATKRAEGYCAYLRIEPGHRVIEIGSIVYSPKIQRSTCATEAMYLAARHVFEDLGYRRYEWKCDALNGPSRKAALRLGFTFEGIFRQHMIVKNLNRDTAWFSMLDTEWPSCKKAFETWLDAKNFDEQGHQHRSLAAFRSDPT